MHFQEFWESCAQNKASETHENTTNALLRIVGLLCAEQNVGNLKNCTFKNSVTPVRRTRRRKSKKHECTFKNSGTPVRRTKRRQYIKMHFRDFWDSCACAQNKTSEISNKLTFRISGTPVRRTKRRKTKQNALSGIMGLLCADQYVVHLETCTFKNSGTPLRRTRRRKSQKNVLSGIPGLQCAEQSVGNLKNCTFRISGTPVRRTRRREFQKVNFQ